MDNSFTMHDACDKLKEDQKAFRPEIEYISSKVKDAGHRNETPCNPYCASNTLIGRLNEPQCNPSYAGKTLADDVGGVLNAISGYRVVAGGMPPELDNVRRVLEHALARYQSSFSEPAGNPPDGFGTSISSQPPDGFGVSLTNQGE